MTKDITERTFSNARPNRPMIAVNFSHPYSLDQRTKIAELTDRASGDIRLIEVSRRFTEEASFSDQVIQLLEETGLTTEEWQNAPIVVGLPAFAPVAAVLLAELHGRCGYFPSVVRIRENRDAIPPVFEVAEILPLQRIRFDASRRRE